MVVHAFNCNTLGQRQVVLSEGGPNRHTPASKNYSQTLSEKEQRKNTQAPWPDVLVLDREHPLLDLVFYSVG